ncbi:MAG: hypothetical protein ABIB04_01175 [Patescibacteria group bacterium]
MKYTMNGNRLWIILIFFVFIALSTLFFVIPSVGTRVFLSPDETAAAVSARSFGSNGTMLISSQNHIYYPWLHPRSYVTVNNGIAPVGFLGLPMILGILLKIFGEWVLVFFVPLLVLSVIFPLWKLLDNLSRNSRLLAIFLWLTFPTVILYANRGLFPNLPVVCLMLWSLYLIKKHKYAITFGLAGILIGFSLAIRPIEAFWILPWVTYFVIFEMSLKKDQRKKMLVYFFVFSLIPIILSLFASWKTYGSPLTIGYWLRDPVSEINNVSNTGNSVTFLPFGFHPRNVWFNVKNYLLGFLGLWTAFSLIGCAVWLKQKKNVWLGLISVWTILSLVFFYGNSIYQDHVGFNVTSLGNSYLRYTLPLVPIMIASMAYLWNWLEKNINRAKTGYSLMLVIAFFGFFGIWLSGGKDDENIFKSAVELTRYESIKSTSLALGTNAIILSDRSDKIFFPDFMVSSPMPANDKVLEVVKNSDYPVLYFGTTASKDEIKKWNKDGLALVPLYRTENQVMYKIVEFSMSIEP